MLFLLFQLFGFRFYDNFGFYSKPFSLVWSFNVRVKVVIKIPTTTPVHLFHT